MNKNIIFFIVLILAGMYTKNGYAQQDAQFSLYMFNKLYYNPAYAGVESVPIASLSYRNQWTGYTTSFDGDGGAPNTIMAAFNIPIEIIGGGIAAHIVNDRIGVQNNTEFHISYAYHLKIGVDHVLGFGISAGGYNKSLDRDRYRWIDDGDPLLGRGTVSEMQPDFAAGVYYRGIRWHAGIGATHLSQPEFNFGQNALQNKLVLHYNYQMGYNLPISSKINISPTILVKTDLSSYSYELSSFLSYQDKIWVGAAFRQTDSITFIAGYAFTKSNTIKLTYAMDYIVSGQVAKSVTSQELQLSYQIPSLELSPKRPIHTPRYIF